MRFAKVRIILVAVSVRRFYGIGQVGEISGGTNDDRAGVNDVANYGIAVPATEIRFVISLQAAVTTNIIHTLFTPAVLCTH